MNVGRTAVERVVAPAVEPNFDDNPFGLFGINFGETGAETLAKIVEAAPEGKSTSVGIAMTGVSSGGKRLTLDWWKVYLDSCASYHTFFIKAFLKNIEESGTMNGNCNAGTTKITKRGYFGKLRVWLNKNGIANLISIAMLEADGYVVRTDTKGEWQVLTPEGK